MTTFFDNLRGIIPSIYRENKSAKIQSGQVIYRKSLFKVDGRWLRWMPLRIKRFLVKFHSKDWTYYLNKAFQEGGEK